MRRIDVFAVAALALSFTLAPSVLTAQCESGDPIEPCHCQTMSPSPPVVGEDVTIALYIGGEQVQIGPPEEPICLLPDELCLGADDVVFDDAGGITFTWTDEMQARVDNDGWSWVWMGNFELLSEVRLQGLTSTGIGCSTCAGVCENPPSATVIATSATHAPRSSTFPKARTASPNTKLRRIRQLRFGTSSKGRVPLKYHCLPPVISR